MKGILAVDIGDQYVKILDVENGEKGLHLKHYAISEIYENGKRMPDEKISKAIKNIVSDMDCESKDARTAISGKSVVVRNVNFPNISKHEILNSVRSEQNRYVPIDLEEYFFDIAVIKSADISEKNTVKGVIAAAKKETVINQTNILNNAGLSTVLVDIDSLALINLYEAISAKTGKEDKITAVIDIGSTSTHVCILLSDSSVFLREINIGGAGITKGIIEKLSCDFDSAEKIKGEGTEDAKEYMAPVVDSLVKELTMTFNFFEGEFGKNVERICFTGGGALIKGFAAAISTGLDIPHEIIDPLVLFGIDIKDDKEHLKRISPVFSVCAGLAVRNVSRPETEKQEKT